MILLNRFDDDDASTAAANLRCDHFILGGHHENLALSGRDAIAAASLATSRKRPAVELRGRSPLVAGSSHNQPLAIVRGCRRENWLTELVFLILFGRLRGVGVPALCPPVRKRACKLSGDSRRGVAVRMATGML
jgi:hypothetical protein